MLRWFAAVAPLLCVCSLDLIAFQDQRSDRLRQRLEYFYGQRGNAGARLQAFHAVQRMARPATAGFSDQWKLIGPRPVLFSFNYLVSGRVNALAVDPRNDDVAYAGAADGGIWKTFDAGATWTPLTDDQPSLATGAIALDPTNPDIVYVGTGEENFNIDAYSGVGILKSTDAGQSWVNIVGPFLRQRIAAITTHPSDGKTLLVAATGGLYRSVDAGATWTSVLTGTAISAFFDTVQPDVAWTSIGNVDGDARNGVYRSTDRGATWNRVNGTAPTIAPSGTLTGRIEIVPAPASPDTVYAAVATAFKSGSSSLMGVYRTTDAGQHWTRLNAPDFCAPQCWYDLVIRPYPADSNVIFAGGQNLVRSMNGGITWQALPSNGVGGAPHVDHHALTFTPDGVRLYDGNDGGVWSTETIRASPVTWNNLNSTFALTQYYPGLSIHPTDPSISLGGSQDNGTHLYRGAMRWTQVIDGDGGYTAIDPSSPTIAYGTYIEVSLYRTLQLDFNDGVETTHGLDQNDRHRFIGAYVLDPSNPQRMYYGTYRLYRSEDGAGLWRPISGDLTNPPLPTSTSSTYTVSTIAVAASDPNVICTGAGSGALYCTTDGGATWVDRSAGLPARPATHVTIDPIDPATVYVTYGGFATAAEMVTGHVFKSNNFGRFWTDITGNLPNLPVNDLLLDPDLIDTLYAATDLGVMVSVDAGTTWAPLGEGLPHVAVTTIVLQRATRTLRAGTHGRSVWDYALPGTSFAPAISSLSPPAKNAGGGDFVLTIIGSNFGPGVHVWWNGADRTVLSATSTTLTVQIPASDIQGVGRAAVIVFNPARGAGVSIPANFVIGPAPSIARGGLVVAAAPANSTTASPGALLSLYGNNLAGGVVQAAGFPLPQTLGQVTLMIGNFPAPIYFVSPGQINFQVPYEISSQSAPSVVVRQGLQASNVTTLAMSRVSPGLFSINQRGDGQGAIRIAGLTTIAAPAGAFPDSRPAHPGEIIEIYCTGLGAVSPGVSTGDAAPAGPLSRTLLQPTVMIGGTPAPVGFSGLTPGVAGLYQVNVTVPAGTAAGSAIPVTLSIGGFLSNTVTIAVE